MNHKISTWILGMILVIGMFGFVFAATSISTGPNLNGFNQFTITNYTEITGIGNFSVGSGTNFFDLYSDGNTNIFDTLGYNAFFPDNVTADEFKGNMSWSYLQDFPVACPQDAYITQVGTSTTCTSISNGTELNGTGTAFACLDANGKLFRKATACA